MNNQTTYNKLDEIQKLYFDFDTEVKKLENVCVLFSLKIEKAIYEILDNPCSYTSTYTITEEGLKNHMQYIRGLHSSLSNEYQGTDYLLSVMYLVSLIDRLYFNISQCVNNIRDDKDHYDPMTDTIEGPYLCLTDEAKYKLIAIEFLNRNTQLEDLSFNEIREKLPIPITNSIGCRSWSLETPKASLANWESLINKEYNLT